MMIELRWTNVQRGAGTAIPVAYVFGNYLGLQQFNAGQIMRV